MSSGHFPEASTSMYLDASRLARALPNTSFVVAQKIVHPSLYPLPRASRPPVASPANATLPAFSPLVPGAYDAGGVYDVPNFQRYNTIYSQAGFIPPLENPAPPMNYANVSATHYPFHDMLVGNVTSTNAPLPLSVDNSHHEQPTPLTFQYSLPMQSETALDQGQVQNLQHHGQAAQDDLAVAEPRRELGDVRGEYYQTNEESHSGLVAQEVYLDDDRCNNQSHPTEENTTIHSCFDNPNSECPGHGDYCLDTLSALVKEYPHVLSPEQIPDFVVDAITPPGPNAGQSPVETGDSPTSTALQNLNMTGSASTSEYLSPTGSFSHSSSNSAAGSSSTGSTRPPAAKRQRSEDDLEVCAKKQRQEECTDARGDRELRNNEIPNDKTKRRRKKKPCDEGEFYCRICLILGKSCRPLSRKDALKRHIATVHELFIALFGHEEFDILKPRRNEIEDLEPLIISCILLQSQARQRGVEITPTYDLALVHPGIAAVLNLS